MTRLCIYHGNCSDGFTAAWVASRWGCDEFFPADHATKKYPDVAGKEVYIVDFSYNLETLKDLAKTAEKIVILDHHKTAQEDLKDLPHPDSGEKLTAIFDMDRSGAQLAWAYFFPNHTEPALVSYVADRDLWKWALPDSKALSAYILSKNLSFKTWDLLDIDFCTLDNRQKVLGRGQAILDKMNRDIDEFIQVAKQTMIIGGHLVPVVNIPYQWASDALNKLCHKQPFAASYYDTEDFRIFSLRSTDIGADVSVIAKQYGGGGHRNASGFRMPTGWCGDR
jgi:uncharacterized protein